MAVRLAAVLFLVIPIVALLSLPLLAEEALTNQDVIKMVQAGLGDEVVIAKIREAPQVSFKLSPDDLVSLHKDGVSEHVVQAMLDRNRPAPQSPEKEMATHLGMDIIDVSLKAQDRTVPLVLVRGEMSTAGFGPWNNIFMNYQGLHARERISDRHPILLVKSSAPIADRRYFIGKLDVDSRNKVRSLKISSGRQGLKAAFGSTVGFLSPDPDWTVPFDAVEESPGLWRVTPKTNLEPGEYGWYIDLGTGVQATGLFDFGVD